MIPYGKLFNEKGLPNPECILVVDAGFSYTHVVPMINGTIVWDAVQLGTYSIAHQALGTFLLLILFLFLLELGAPVWPVLLLALLLYGPVPHWWRNYAVALLLLSRRRARRLVFIRAVVVLFFFGELGELGAAVEAGAAMVGVLLVVLVFFRGWRRW